MHLNKNQPTYPGEIADSLVKFSWEDLPIYPHFRNSQLAFILIWICSWFNKINEESQLLPCLGTYHCSGFLTDVFQLGWSHLRSLGRILLSIYSGHWGSGPQFILLSGASRHLGSGWQQHQHPRCWNQPRRYVGNQSYRYWCPRK